MQTVHEEVQGWASCEGTKPGRGTWRPGSLELMRSLILVHKTPTELLYMLVQIDPVCSSEQTRENDDTINTEI